MLSGPQTESGRVETFWAGAQPTWATKKTASVNSFKETSSDHEHGTKRTEGAGRSGPLPACGFTQRERSSGQDDSAKSLGSCSAPRRSGARALTLDSAKSDRLVPD